MRFRTRIELGGKTATGFSVPAAVVAALNSGKRPRVYVTIAGHTYRSTVAVYGGEFMLPLNAENRTKAAVAAGDDVDVDLKLDTEPRTVSIPDDLARALDSDPTMRQRFDELSYSTQREHVESIMGAKTSETRERRINRTMHALKGDWAPRQNHR